MAPASLLQPLLASNVAFILLFGAFVAAFLVLSVIVVRWAFRRDSAGRAAWRGRQMDRHQASDESEPPPSPPS
jgi:hypothetical protein